jgi:hypothetical protein
MRKGKWWGGLIALCYFTILSQENAKAVIGIPDETPAATLVVPLLEAGISSSHNTLVVANNVCNAKLTIHWEVWNVEGANVDLFGNAEIVNYAAWVSDFVTILRLASQAQKTQLTDGAFYRGFLTIDVVNTTTNALPTEESYPFSAKNCLKGLIYYVRLPEGAADGIPAVHIEGGVSGVNTNARGFYQSRDDREKIDNHARHYAELTTRGLPVADDDAFLDLIINRVYLSPTLNGASRIVIWAWGPPAWGAQGPGDGGRGPFPAAHRGENGQIVATSSLNLPRVVNIINVSGTANGEVWIEKLPEHFNVYAFSFNTASLVAGNAALTWEVMFPSTIIAE